MRMSHNDMILVITAQRDKKEVEAKRLDWKPIDLFEWSPIFSQSFNFDRFEYRIKPEPPKPREWWIVSERVGATGIPLNPQLFPIDSSPIIPPHFNVIHVREVLPEEEGKA